MVDAFSKRRMAENEAVFREYNEKATEKLQSARQEEQESEIAKKDEHNLHFYCEFSDEDCHERVALKPSEYNKHHQERDKFVVLPGHEVEEVENVIATYKSYIIVKKHEEPPKKPGTLKLTPFKNTSNHLNTCQELAN
jgi:hypothetical protein